MARSGKIEIQIVGDSSGLSRAFKSASRDAGSFGSKVGSAVGSIAKAGLFAGVAAGVVGISAVLKAGIGEWQQQAKVASATGAILKSTGGVANVTAKQVSDLAQSIMAKTGIDDEAIQAGENLLLTFKNVHNEVGRGNDVFNRATKAAVDLSSAGFGSMESASKMLGKALNDPVKGMTALSRAGVTFSDAQKETIKSLVSTGDTLAAQKLILTEVESQVGGVAEAYGKTLPGQIDVLKEQFNNLSGTVVGALAPAFAKGLEATNNFIRKFSEADGAAAKFRVVAGTIKDAAVAAGEGLLKAFRSIDWNQVARTLADGAKTSFNFLVTTIRNVDWGQLGRMVGQFLIKEWNTLASWINRVDWNNVGQALVQGMGKAIKAFGQFLAGVNWGAVFSAFINYMSAFLRGVGGLLLGIGIALGKAIIDGLKAGAVAAWGIAKTWFASLKDKIVGLFSGAIGWLASVGSDIIQGIQDGAVSKFNAVKGWFEARISELKGLAGKLVPGGGGGGAKPKGSEFDIGFGAPRRGTQSVQRGADAVIETLKRRNKEILALMRELQGALDKVNQRREREDLASAVRNAQATLAQVRHDKKSTQTQIEEAERALARAREDIRLSAENKELTATQAAQAKLQAQLDKALEARKAAQQKAADKAADALRAQLDKQQRILEAAQDRAASSFDRFAGLVREAFSAAADAWISPAQQDIDERNARRRQEDMAQAVSDANERLQEALAGGDPGAIAAAQREVNRAREDVVVAGLEEQARIQQTAHDQEIAAQERNLDTLLGQLRTKFAEQGVTTATGMQTLLAVINSYAGGFKDAGDLLGGEFAKALQAAMNKAVADSAGIPKQGGSGSPSVAQILRDAAKSASSVIGNLVIPKLDSGGVVSRTGLAVVHRGETFSGVGKSGGMTVNVTVNGFVGNDQDIAARIVDTINRQQRVGRMRFAT